MPIPVMHALCTELRQRLAGRPAEVVSYGHIGDGNLHLNVSVPAEDADILAIIEPFVYEWTSRHRGSISAEHGLGQMKNEYVAFSKPDTALEVMAALKTLFDPNAILNPYKYLPTKYRERRPRSAL